MNIFESVWFVMPKKIKNNAIILLCMLGFIILLIYLIGYYMGYEAALVQCAIKIEELRPKENATIFNMGWL